MPDLPQLSDPDLIEAMARAMYDWRCLRAIEDRETSGAVAWDDTSESVREWYRNEVKEPLAVVREHDRRRIEALRVNEAPGFRGADDRRARNRALDAVKGALGLA